MIFCSFVSVKNLNLDTVLFYSLLLAFGMAYLIFFPQGWLISDEYSYVNQAIAMTKGDVSLTYIDLITDKKVPYGFTRYALGNSTWIAIWVKLLGVKWIYVGSLVSIIGGAYLLYQTFRREKLSTLALLLLFIYPSLAFFGRSTMSAIPSFLLSCIFIWVLMSSKESAKKWLLLCMIASFSFWFRETNIILLGVICLVHFIQDRRWFMYYALGTLLGFLPRLISAYFIYDDPFYYVFAEPFLLASIKNNILIYAILILAAMPLGVFFLGTYKGRYRIPIVISSFVFLSLYLCYSFNASTYSGFSKGLILMGRFLIPLLPFYVLTVAWYFRSHNINKNVKILLITLGVLIIFGMQYKVNQESQLHKSVSNQVYSKYSDDFVFFDLSRRTNVVRYLNPMHGTFAGQSDLSKLKDKSYVEKVMLLNKNIYIIQTLNSANQAKTEKTAATQSVIQEAKSKYLISEVEEIKIQSGLKLQVLKLEAKR